MHKVMIVDDEPLIREGMLTIIDWREHGFEICSVAVDGNDALSQLDRCLPELMIVDIRMPGLDGMQLMKKVRERRSDMHFLILSGYADFDYARTAITVGADGYMLKPVDEDELIEYLAKVRKELAAAREQPFALTLQREAWLESYMADEEPPAPSAPVMEQLDLAWRHYQVLLIEVTANGQPEQQTVSLLKKRLADCVAAGRLGVPFHADPYLAVLLRQTHKTELQLRVLRGALLKAVEPHRARIRIALGSPSDSLSQARRSYRQAIGWMQRKFFFREDEIASEYTRDAAAAEREAEGPPDLKAAADKLSYLLDLGSSGGAAKLLEQTALAMVRADWNELEVKQAFVQLFGTAMTKHVQQHSDCRVPQQEALGWLGEVRVQPSLERLLDYLTDRIERFVQSCGADSPESIVRRMTDLIHRNYGDPLKLESLADIFNYNSAYLGKLFKSSTGEYFNTYLDKVRIEQAKRLLDEGMKVYQAAERVGYGNVDYFHTKFKKYVGVSPSEYKKKH